MRDALATLFEDIDQDYAHALNNPETDAVGVRHWRDVVFANDLGFRPLMLYASVPPVKSPPPLIVFIHGGAWRLGHPQVTNPIYRRLDFIGKFLRAGFAVAKISYRLSGEDRFPTQLHDCKAAIRFLRNHADVFGFDPNRFAVSCPGALRSHQGGYHGHVTGPCLEDLLPHAAAVLEGLIEALDVERVVLSAYGLREGVLFEAMNPPHTMTPAIISRLKIMSNLDIAERRLPQDGRIRAMIHGRKIDLRLSTLPTPNGEKCVMRILDNKSINVALEDLGFGEDALTIWKKQIDQPHGILLVTGPTGSGKTTTLYSSLRCMDGNKMNISTVEDPIEYHLASATQVQVTDKIGMTFSAALRSLLRQDPDVVMLGEIRDKETANIAVQAALTGHLVLSTLHTNDAPASVTRLINIGVEPYLISSAVNAILAQRLVRKICPHCKAEYKPSDEMREFLTLQGFTSEVMYQGAGCDRCRKTGYTGRLGIYELLVMDDSLRDMVTGNPDVNQLRKMCRERGLVTLREDGFQKVMKGLTTVDEILRVAESAM